jgi:hypothetical protein
MPDTGSARRTIPSRANARNMISQTEIFEDPYQLGEI